MGKLGSEILNAMREQGWLITFEGETVMVRSPEGSSRFWPINLMMEENEPYLRHVLLNIQIEDGFQWPWPPDHREGFHGEVPRSGG